VTDAAIDTTVAIEAPEQIRFRYRLAGPSLRAVAHLVDLVIIGFILGAAALIGAIFAIPFLLGGTEGADKTMTGVILLVVFTLQWGYFTLFEALRNGQTPGKAMFSLRVVKDGGEPIGLVDATLRNLVRAADLLPVGYLAGVVSMLIDPRFRRLGDLVAGTMVVVEDRLTVATPLYVMPPTPDEARTLPMRVVLDADELRAIEAFLRRAIELGPELSAELAATVAAGLARRHGYWHSDPVRLLALLYLRASEPLRLAGAAARGAIPGLPASAR